MKKTTTLATVAASVLAAAMLMATATHAKDEPPPAQNVTTVWVGGKGQTQFAEKSNEMHAAMEAKGWKFADMEIYTEDGDMQGAFITYTR